MCPRQHYFSCFRAAHGGLFAGTLCRTSASVWNLLIWCHFWDGIEPPCYMNHMNPCKCGFYGDSTRECRCTPGQIQHYLGKISGPLLDRIDVHVEIPSVPFKELRGNPTAESSAEIRARVEQSRTVQRARGFYNSRMPARDV